MRKIVIYGESTKNGMTSATKELLTAGSSLCKNLAAQLIAVFINTTGEAATAAIYHGADEVYTIDDPRIGEYQPELYLAAMKEFCVRIDPDTLLFAHTYPAADLAPRLAFRLGTSLTTDCIELSIDPETGLLLRTKPIYGGNIVATYSSHARPQMATVREKVFTSVEGPAARKGEILSFILQSDLPTPRVKSLQKVVEEYTGKKLEGAEIVVSGGRGMGSEKGFEELAQLAELLDGTLGGSRPAVEKGWIHSRFQVGLTGVRISPKLYIAVGISGSIQHIAGVVGAKTIVAINKDSEANIFKEAHYGVVGDYKQIMPGLMERLKKHLENR
jgi:electron transfer flavoprotein alpha subunit